MRFAAWIVLLTLACSHLHAAPDSYPSQPIKLIVGFSAGSVTDRVARLLAEGLRTEIDATVIVDNVSGAGSTLATARVARAPADGYTLLFAAPGHFVVPLLYKNLPYDPVNDLTGVALVAVNRVMIVANPKIKANTLKEFIALAKAEPNKFTYGSSGNGTYLHLLGESLMQQSGVQLLHVPYRAGAEATQAVLAGTLDIGFCAVSNCIGHVRAGTLKTFGFIGTERSPFAPDIPTTVEGGMPQLTLGASNFILAPKGTPQPVLNKLHDAVRKVVISAEFRDKLRATGATPLASQSTAEVDAFVKREFGTWIPLAEAAKLKIQ